MNGISFPNQRGVNQSPAKTAYKNKTESAKESSRPGWGGESASVSISRESASRTDAYSRTGQLTYSQAYGAVQNENVKTAASKLWNGFRPEITEHEVYGQVIGEPQLSDKASDYLKSLKSKFGGLDFVVVGRDQVSAAKAYAASYGNANHMVVLIDEDKLERMATDENYRKKYEAIISQAAGGGSKLSSLAAQNPLIKKIGYTTDENGAGSFIAVCAKNNASIFDRVAKKRAEKKEQAKAEKKHAEKKHAEEARREHIEERRHKAHELEKKLREHGHDHDEIPDDAREKIDRKIREVYGKFAIEEEDFSEYMDNDEYEIITADSMDELIAKLESYNEQTGFAPRSYAGVSSEEGTSGRYMDFQA